MPHFTQNFAADFDAAISGVFSPSFTTDDEPPYAFARFGDGEWAILCGGKHDAAKHDGWLWSGPGDLARVGQLPHLLRLALQSDMPGWHVGISCHERRPQCHRELAALVRVPKDRLTVAEIFYFANYPRFAAMLGALLRCIYVGAHVEGARAAGFRECVQTPAELFDPLWKSAAFDVAEKLVREAKAPILVAAGPWGKAIIHRYWQRTAGTDWRQSIIDVGSSLDPVVRGAASRHHHGEKSHRRKWAVRFGPAKS